MTVDFHVHSTASDGTFAPAEIAAKAKGFAAIALTDHDNCDGVEEFGNGGNVERWKGEKGEECRRVAGIELSIEPGEGFDKFHLLGIGIDPENAGLKAYLKRVLDGRNARNERIIANFRRLGIEMVSPLHDSTTPSPRHPATSSLRHLGTIYSYSHGEVLARPHFARWLIDHGFAADVKSAFEKYLLPDSPAETRCYEERWHPPQEESFRVIHEAGGLCVMAHPKYWRRTWKDEGADFAAAERGLSALKEKGLDGVESLYQANTVEENIAFTRLALKLGFLTTAGSDFHGANKPTIALGMEVSEAFIAPVLERLS